MRSEKLLAVWLRTNRILLVGAIPEIIGGEKKLILKRQEHHHDLEHTLNTLGSWLNDKFFGRIQ